MRNYFLFATLVFGYSLSFAQNGTINAFTQQANYSGNTYAVIIGISKYENTGITQLEYADRDAKVFASYLESKAGGSVPPENIRLLINENATLAAVYDAMSWLMESCQKGDKVYFYFSGHGDMENNTIYKLGFLLTYNTPRFNYLNNAVRLEDLNNFANTLSVQKQAKVVLITDACHSGDLAGNVFRGSFLVGDQLRAVQGNEVRITSCGPDQLSNEDEGWGGGRGVFSYYLVNGMIGLADNQNKGFVTVKEIENYLDTSLSRDILLSQKNQKQSPVINGPANFQLAMVNTASLDSLKKGFSSGNNLQNNQATVFLKPLPVQPPGYFFDLIKGNNIEELVDFNKLDQLPKEDIPLAFIKMVTDTLQKQSALLQEDLNKIDQLKKSFVQNADALKRFNDKLVVVLGNRGQQVINLYLNGDVAELERRRYYNTNSSGYDVYPKMFSVALKLADPQSQLYHILQVKLHYFTGVAARLKMPTVENPKPLFDLAMSEQQKAFQIEENTAYIQNELGILYEFKKDYTASEKYFFRATQIAPTWAVPWSNMCGLYALEKKIDKSFEAGHIADSLQPDLQNNSINLGIANETSGNLLFAEEDYRKAIEMNSRHYLPFERLGFLYTNTTQYAQADSFFYEADIRKKGYHFKGNQWGFAPAIAVLPATIGPHCNFDTAVLKKDDLMAFFTWGVQNYQKKDYPNAVRILKRVIALDKRNPLVFHYLGKIFYDQKKWEEAELMFKYAIDYYKEDTAFEKYCDSISKKAHYPYDHSCFENFFRLSQYHQIEDFCFISTLYETWGHYDEAETYYKKIIALKPDYLEGYIMFWQMLEKLGRYEEAEKAIQSYAAVEPERTDRELNAFYRRAIQVFPAKTEWYLKLSLLLYQRAAYPARTTYFDSIVYFPELNKEIFIDSAVRANLQVDPFLHLDQNQNKIPATISLTEVYEQKAAVTVDGTGDIIDLADPIYTPRKDAIYYLTKTAGLITDSTTVADLNYKAGNVFIWAGSRKQSYPYYTKAVQMMPGNASARMKAVEVGNSIYKFRAALDNLNYLYDKQQINFSDRLLLVKYFIHAGQFEKAGKILGEAENIHPYTVPEITDLYGRLNLLFHKWKEAIGFYQQYQKMFPQNNATMYTIARIFALSGNKTEAMKWLKMAIEKGFKYYWVLHADASWEDFQNSNEWESLVVKIPKTTYKSSSK